MASLFYPLLLTSLVALPAFAVTPSTRVVPASKTLALAQQRVPEQPTVFVFWRPDSSLEQAFVQGLQKQAGPKVGFREIHLKSGSEPLARQYEVSGTPTALVYDRRGRFVGRSSVAAEITALVTKAAQVMRIDWAEPGDPRFAEMERTLNRPGPSIMRTISLRPDWMRHFWQLHSIEHIPNTALDRRTKEMIATYVSALNKCKY